jgi:hypothetical protein
MVYPVPNINDGSANRLPVAWQNVSADGAISTDMASVILTYAGATAITLAAPDASMNGFTMHIVSTVAQAHVITATNLINGNNDTLTWGGAIGDSCTLMAYDSEWLTMQLTNVTVG